MKKIKQKLNRDRGLKRDMNNPFRRKTLVEYKVKKIIKIVRRIRKKCYKLIIRGEMPKDEFKEDFADFMIGNLENDLDEIEDIAHEIDKETKSSEGKNKKVNKD